MDFGPDHARAADALRLLLAQIDGGPSGPVVADLAAAYLTTLRGKVGRGEAASATLALRSTMLARLGSLGTVPAISVRGHHVVAWLDSFPDDSPTTRSLRAVALSQAVRCAIDSGVLESDPLTAWKRPPGRPNRKTIPDDATLERWFAAMSAPLQLFAQFLADTGARSGEARALEARHIGGEWISLTNHKTARKTGRDRTIWIPPEWRTRLAKLCLQHPYGPLFRTTRNQPWRAQTLCWAASRAARKIGQPSLTLHTLRHRRATLWLKAGLHPTVVATLLGHANANTTLATYSHVDRDLDHVAAQVRGLAG
jgi:integrase